MKLLLILAITINLFARLNPFEPVFTTNKIKIQKVESSNNVYSRDDGNRTVKIMPNIKKVVKPKQIVMVKERIIEKVITKKLTNKELQKQCKIMEKTIPKKIKKVRKKHKEFVSMTYNVLPFITITSNKTNLVIKTRLKYKLIRYYDEANERKFVFDFKGKVLNYTKRRILDAPYFKSYVIGNHAEDEFFRVVIKVKRNTNLYKIFIKNNIATISYK
jgi:hypothetical protein